MFHLKKIIENKDYESIYSILENSDYVAFEKRPFVRTFETLPYTNIWDFDGQYIEDIIKKLQYMKNYAVESKATLKMESDYYTDTLGCYINRPATDDEYEDILYHIIISIFDKEMSK